MATASTIIPSQAAMKAAVIHGGMPWSSGRLSASRRRGDIAPTSSLTEGGRDTGDVQPIILSDEQREFRKVRRQFCDDKIAPRAAEGDETAEYPWHNFQACVSMELPALGMPVEYGGAGTDHMTP